MMEGEREGNRRNEEKRSKARERERDGTLRNPKERKLKSKNKTLDTK